MHVVTGVTGNTGAVVADALLAARERLHVTFVGRSAKDDSPCAPSVVLSELLDHLDRLKGEQREYTAPQRAVVVQHPLQAWSPRYRDGRDPRLFTFARHDLRGVARASGDAPPWIPGEVAPPLAFAGDEVPLARLEEFWKSPCRFFLQHTMALCVRASDDSETDTEPFQMNKSPLYLDALLGYEDRWFWRHPGVNPLALARAAAQMLRYRHPVSGGSTLTMQVARILDPHSRTPWGKAKQVFRALQLEAHCSKREILTLYLDRAPFGGTIEGVEAASWAYLGKPAQRLSHAEAALLAVLPQSPSRLRPDREPAAAQRARDKVLDRLATLGVWDATTVADARIEQVATRALAPPLKAALLAERLRSAQPQQARIASSIDRELQDAMEARVTAYLTRLPERTSAALLVVDNATLEARAYVGSGAFGDEARLGHVDMVRAARSPLAIASGMPTPNKELPASARRGSSICSISRAVRSERVP